MTMTLAKNRGRDRVRIVGRSHTWNRALNERLEREGLQVQNAEYEDFSRLSATTLEVGKKYVGEKYAESLYLFDLVGEEESGGIVALRGFMRAIQQSAQLLDTSVLLLASPQSHWSELLGSLEPLLRTGHADFVRLSPGEASEVDAWEEVVQRAHLLLERRAQHSLKTVPEAEDATDALSDDPTVNSSGDSSEAQTYMARVLSPFPAFQSPLTQLHNEASGRMDAKKVALFFGLPLATLAKLLGTSSQAMHKTPDAPSLQSGLAPFHFVAVTLLGMVERAEAARIWLNAPNEEFDGEVPLDLIKIGEVQVIAELLRDALVGQPG